MKIETSNSFLQYLDNIMFVRIKEGVELTIESMHEQYEAQNKLIGNDQYVVLVDGTQNAIIPPETRSLMAQHRPPNRRATAIVTNKNLATLIIANNYLKMNKPKIKTKLFKQEDKAIFWLKRQLKKK